MDTGPLISHKKYTANGQIFAGVMVIYCLLLLQTVKKNGAIEIFFSLYVLLKECWLSDTAKFLVGKSLQVNDPIDSLYKIEVSFSQEEGAEYHTMPFQYSRVDIFVA